MQADYCRRFIAIKGIAILEMSFYKNDKNVCFFILVRHRHSQTGRTGLQGLLVRPYTKMGVFVRALSKQGVPVKKREY